MKLLNKTKIPFYETKTEIPIVKFTLNSGKEAYAIIDTGSETTAFDFNLIKENKDCFTVDITHGETSLVGVANKKNKVPTVYAEANLNILDATIKIKCLCVPLSHITQHYKELGDDIIISAIIGSDVLQATGAKINYRKRELVL